MIMRRAACHPLGEDLSFYQGMWSAFAELLDDVATGLARLQPATVWTIEEAGGAVIGEVTLGDFARKFDNLSWTLTNNDYGLGVGNVSSRFEGELWLGATVELRAPDFYAYLQWPQRQGATYMALHETAHTTKLGLELNANLYDQFIHDGGSPDSWAGSARWWYNEVTANLIARKVADAIGLPILPQPTGGYAPMMRGNDAI